MIRSRPPQQAKRGGVGISVQVSLLVLSLSFPKHLSKAMTTLYRKALAPARKPYRKGLLLTHKNGDFRVVSGNEAKLRRDDLESVGSSNRFLYWARIFFMLTCHFQP